VRAVSARIPL